MRESEEIRDDRKVREYREISEREIGEGRAISDSI